MDFKNHTQKIERGKTWENIKYINELGVLVSNPQTILLKQRNRKPECQLYSLAINKLTN